MLNEQRVLVTGGAGFIYSHTSVKGRDRPIRRYCGSQATHDTFAKLR
jgi:hypothetical protein